MIGILLSTVSWDEEGTVCRPDGLTQGDASKRNCQPLLLMGIAVMARGAAEGAHLQKRLGMCFLSPFPCFHGNSSKQEQPAWNFSAYRPDTPCPIIPADFWLLRVSDPPSCDGSHASEENSPMHVCHGRARQRGTSPELPQFLWQHSLNVIPCTLIASCK